ncbi:uncharacterized protein EV422DRAFT_546899 [Fimicolochytrium jonesii]|uniref:uncharacterized protein n=1 Tax=Fimicolochytrium jonesii TaxID=1396493 RepID=UPI0022FE4FD5|nr:uncharacterized protein EV422DRAFT_546899 [Fimicolochytrium jonesii]KAI8816133.1 hypothetical protein EV422DRAFT_546899 [Fimicolochytrium jonesii]
MMLGKQAQSNDPDQLSFIRKVEQAVIRNPNNDFLMAPTAEREAYVPMNGERLASTVRRAVDHYEKLMGRPESPDKRVVAYLSTSHPGFFLNILALMSLDYVPVVLSPKNSMISMVDILQKSKAVAIVYEPKQFKAIVDEMVQAVPDVKKYEAIDFTADLTAGNHTQTKDDVTETGFGIRPEVLAENESPSSPDRVVAIMHSSGSTSMPKIRFWTNQCIDHNTNKPRMMARTDTNGFFQRLLVFAPVSHALGLWQCSSAVRAAATVVFPLRAFPHRGEDILKAIELGKPDYVTTAPSLIEDVVRALEREPEMWRVMETVHTVLTGGAPCPQAVGDKMVEHGINMRSGYGSTEAGTVLAPIAGSKEWNLLQPTCDPKYLKWQPYGERPGFYRLFVRTDYPGFAGNVTSEEWYDTNDIWRDNGDGRYEYRGRGDDIIVHVNGEKSNPIPLEMVFRSFHPLIKDALILGNNRFQTSAFILLDAHEALQFSPAEMLEIVDRAVEAANVVAASHTKLVGELVEVLPLGHEDFPRTESKGNVKRRLAEKILKERCDRLYDRYENARGGDGDSAAAGGKNLGDIKQLVIKAVAAVMNRPATSFDDPSQHETSLFELGLDSLGATQLRNLLSRETGVDLPRDLVINYSSVGELVSFLEKTVGSGSGGLATSADLSSVIREKASQIIARPLGPETDDVSLFELGLDSLGATTLSTRLTKQIGKQVWENDIFAHSSVSGLAAVLTKSGTGPQKKQAVQTSAAATTQEHPQLAKARQLEKKYTAMLTDLIPFATASPTTPQQPGSPRTVLLSGATGALGTAILETLLSLPTVSRVYSLHRGGNDLTRERQSFESRFLDSEIITRAENAGRVVGLSSAFNEKNLGVSDEAMFRAIQDNVTDVLHVAWPVNWSFPVDAFDSTLMGVYNLIKLCTTSPKRKTLHFVSSIAAYSNPKGKSIPEEPVPADPGVASRMGYGLSKWVAERVIEAASNNEQLKLQASIFRAGQLSADSKHGVWNKTDFWVGVVASGINLGVLPELPATADDIDWMPVDYAANSILQLAGILPQQNWDARQTSDANTFDVYHIASPNRVSWPAVIKALTAATSRRMRTLPPAEWVGEVSKPASRAKNPAVQDQMIPVFESMFASRRQAGEQDDTAETAAAEAESGINAKFLDTARTAALSEVMRACIPMSDVGYWRAVRAYLAKVGMLDEGVVKEGFAAAAEE